MTDPKEAARIDGQVRRIVRARREEAISKLRTEFPQLSRGQAIEYATQIGQFPTSALITSSLRTQGRMPKPFVERRRGDR